ncbi:MULTISPECIES: mannose/fructose/sorbose PTS transporter subunit IIB [Clostridium]|jgi:PTS system, mannose/fructose/sorbose family, IIB component|uniref:PTS fructose transporter subunit IIB n=2 Tax=Clostridium beijerinckii TaxID=1520 RepID=A0A0B5QP24_CLOBE|nr:MULTISPECIES: mannose/fructose/sorbose PTS transporter subunit IIB [Clostridium]ABR34011.1 PTS system, mannose/fructose/sorbose family, IIB subunit [Clostridium beijerinckii NCIMB 8052]AIU04575.1 PTS system mannose/fructose/sorbose family IIB subunit [Clostridium beijerinckii ATCC 35702]AJG98598.1 PTS fructose transporter subunit IIB [Clostridium beijerinckii]MBE6089189.1 PTS fructose transporter subunit IIB [Clostridium beijerinckii]MBF7811384.1 PTS sugar transporter subunit IIB [Clostridi
MEISFVRIDDRLIHGQIATIWSKASGCNRIMACSDEVAKDDLRKQLLLQVALKGIKAYVIPIETAIKAYKDPKYKNFKTLFLFTNPADVLRMIEGGVDIKSVNVGGMCYKDGKKQITGAISVNNQDIECFKKLYEKGIELEIRQVAKDNKINLIDRLKELKFL